MRKIEPLKRKLILKAMDIDLWQPRPFKHPETLGKTVVLVPDKIIVQASCLVVLAAPINETEETLQGMLGVLNLKPEELMISTLYNNMNSEINMNEIESTIVKWAPRSILQLGFEIPKINSHAFVMQTYHPSHLMQFTKDKSQAYVDLLKLRSFLHNE